ncbi:Phox-like protein [Amniculicola lignicola CBS 123094]|uniref:Phox-like protein n=1 Tax=Amniculicola lignicola CBS 123094 TaxID=1392246 RepID=A0A6A5WG04_9PLEO|nr:Phox-like protein [Amniculicola lignicola CBS 123094]
MPPLRISIPSAHTDTPEQGKPFTEYEIRVAHPFPRGTTTVHKRYSDFATLDATLRSQAGAAPPVALPPKSWLGGSLGKIGLGSTTGSPEMIEKRREGLEKYLQAIETGDDGRWKVCKVYREFLNLSDKDQRSEESRLPGSQFGKDRVQDSGDWLDKFSHVKSSLQEARLWLTRREQSTTATTQHDAAVNAKARLVRAGTLLSSLEEALGRFGQSGADEWGGEKLGDGEIRRRRDLIGSARKERDGLESVLNSLAVKAAVSSSSSTSSAAVSDDQKSALFTSKPSAPSGRRVLGAPLKETNQTRELDNEGVLQLQKQIMAEQDQDVLDLTKVVRRMREMGVAINEEIVEQNAMLTMLDDDAGRVDDKMRIAKKRIGQL